MKRGAHYSDAQPFGADSILYTACVLARKYSHRVPTPKELMAEWGMSRATAYRWVRAVRDAWGKQ